jgi:serine/threonine-protein kinase
MSPEQATGAIGEIDYRTDTYMLSGMLYEIITGGPPFDQPDVDTVIQQVINDVPLPARERVPNCPAWLERLCVKGLRKDRDQRFQTAEELIDQVQGWIAGRADRRKADRQFQRFFEMAFDAMGIVDFRRGLQNLNSAWEVNFGWNPKEITGRTHYEMIHPEDQVRAARALSKANKTKKQQQVTVRLLCQDGTYQWSRWSLAPYVEEASVCIIGRRVDPPEEDAQK